jgi:hypothetical protein
MVFGGGIGRFARGKASGSEEDAASNKPEEHDNSKEQGLPVASTGADNDTWMQFDHQPVASEFEGFGGQGGTDFSYNDGGFNFDDMMGSAATTDTTSPENDSHGSHTLNKSTTTAGAGPIGPMKTTGMGLFSSRPKPSANSSTILEAKVASSVNKNDSATSVATFTPATTKPSNPSGISLFGGARTAASSISQLPTSLKSAPHSQPSIRQNQQRSAAACSNPPMPQQRATNVQQNQISAVSANNERILPGNSNSTRILPVGLPGTAKKSVTPSPSNAVLPLPTPPFLNHRHAGGNNNNPVVPKSLSHHQGVLMIPEKQLDVPRLDGRNLDNRNNASAPHFQTPAASRSRNRGQSTAVFATPLVPAAVTPLQDTPPTPVLFHKTPASQARATAKASQLVTPTTLDSSSFTTTATITVPNTFQESLSTSEETRHGHQESCFGSADVPSFDDLHAKFLSDTRDLEDLQNENASQLLDMDVLLSTALSASLKDQVDFMDLLQQLQKEVDLADATIHKYLML